jgi:predicted ABC-type ATPase
MMGEARELGYDVDFVFIALDAPEMHVLRVATRVEDGGHDIPTNLIVARYAVSTGVRLGQGYDAADTFRLLTSSPAGSFRVLVVAEHG